MTHSTASGPSTQATMDRFGVSPSALRATQEAYLRINYIAAAERLWERHLSLNDRKRLGNDLASAWTQFGGTVGMFMEARRVDYVEAIIQVAALLGFLTTDDREWLRREWRLPATSPTNLLRPVWNPETGKLYWNRQLIRTVRLSRSHPSNVHLLLSRFEDNNWPEIVDSPFRFEAHLHDALRMLKRGLTGITFSAANGGTRCRWSPLADDSNSCQPNDLATSDHGFPLEPRS